MDKYSCIHVHFKFCVIVTNISAFSKINAYNGEGDSGVWISGEGNGAMVQVNRINSGKPYTVIIRVIQGYSLPMSLTY